MRFQPQPPTFQPSNFILQRASSAAQYSLGEFLEFDSVPRVEAVKQVHPYYLLKGVCLKDRQAGGIYILQDVVGRKQFDAFGLSIENRPEASFAVSERVLKCPSPADVTQAWRLVLFWSTSLRLGGDLCRFHHMPLRLWRILVILHATRKPPWSLGIRAIAG